MFNRMNNQGQARGPSVDNPEPPIYKSHAVEFVRGCPVVGRKTLGF
jgi:hypothetical protein